MGYLIKVSRLGQSASFLSAVESRCYVQHDSIGLSLVASKSMDPKVAIFELEAVQGSAAVGFRPLSFNLFDCSGVSLVPDNQTIFEGLMSVYWEDFTFKILVVSLESFYRTALNCLDILMSSPALRIQCAEPSIDLPLYPGSTFTIGSHFKDAITIKNSLLKPAHAQISVSKDGKELEVVGVLGRVESRVESGISFFRLLPADIELKVAPIL